MRFVWLIAAILGAYEFWPCIEADERLTWAALLRAAYFVGMWALTRSDT